MRRIGFELTDRCNLACAHCLRETNADKRSLDARLVAAALGEAARLGFDEAVFTGGEPTLHPDFAGLVRAATAVGLALTVVSNGQRPAAFRELARDAGVRDRLTVALSLEAAEPAAFDAVRGRGAFRRFMATLAALTAAGVRVRLAATVGPWNRRQWPLVLALAAQSGVMGVSVACYQPAERGLPEAESVRELAELHAFIEAAAAAAAVPVTLAYEPLTRRAVHQCATLALHDLNVNHRGEATFCCQLSTLHHASHPEAVVVGRLQDGVAAVLAAQARNVAAFLEAKVHAWQGGPPEAQDEDPCAYCRRVFGQVAWKGLKHAA